MFGFSSHQRIPCTFATGASISSAINVAGANHVSFEFPTFASYVGSATVQVYAQVCKTSDGTFRRVMEQGIYSAGSGILDWEVPFFAGSRTVVCHPAPMFNFVKVELSAVTTASMGCWVHVHE
jgi:hypothetical protein